MNKNASLVLIAALLISVGIVLIGNPRSSNSNTPVQNSEIRDGVQYVTIDANGGYLPRSSIAKAGIPTKLIIKTEGTFDCSASLVIPSIKYQKILPQTGETEIDIGTPEVGKFQGLCSMGMYSFVIDFT